MPRSPVTWLYAIGTSLLLLAGVLLAVRSFRLGFVEWGVSQAIVLVIWALATTLVLRAISRATIARRWKAAWQTFVATLALFGGFLGLMFGSMSGIVMSYGRDETYVAQNYPLAFGLGVAVALVPALTLSAIVALVVIVTTKRGVQSDLNLGS